MVGPTLTKIENLNLNLISGSFVKDLLLFLLFTKSAPPKVPPRALPPRPPPCWGPAYSTREAHFANYINKLKLQIGATRTSRYMPISGQR